MIDLALATLAAAILVGFACGLVCGAGAMCVVRVGGRSSALEEAREEARRAHEQYALEEAARGLEAMAVRTLERAERFGGEA